MRRTISTVILDATFHSGKTGHSEVLPRLRRQYDETRAQAGRRTLKGSKRQGDSLDRKELVHVARSMTPRARHLRYIIIAQNWSQWLRRLRVAPGDARLRQSPFRSQAPTRDQRTAPSTRGDDLQPDQLADLVGRGDTAQNSIVNSSPLSVVPTKEDVVTGFSEFPENIRVRRREVRDSFRPSVDVGASQKMRAAWQHFLKITHDTVDDRGVVHRAETTCFWVRDKRYQDTTFTRLATSAVYQIRKDRPRAVQVSTLDRLLPESLPTDEMYGNVGAKWDSRQ